VSVHLLLSAGRGPQECAWALSRLLRRLEADGLVNHDESGGRKVYRLTDRGHAEVDARRADIDALESDIRSMSELAESLGADVRTTVRDIGDDLKAAAKRLTESTQHSRRRPHDRHRQAWPEAVEFDQSAGMIDAQLHVLVSRVRELVARRPPTSEQIGACAMILHDSYLRVSEVFADDEE